MLLQVSNHFKFAANSSNKNSGLSLTVKRKGLLGDELKSIFRRRIVVDEKTRRFQILLSKLKNHNNSNKGSVSATTTDTNTDNSNNENASVNTLGHFWKVLATNFLPKVSQMYCDFLGSFGNHLFLSKISYGYFWAFFGKICATFISASGHTTASRLPFESVKCVKVGTWMVAVDFSWIGSGMELFGRGLGKVVSAQLVSYCVCDKPP